MSSSHIAGLLDMSSPRKNLQCTKRAVLDEDIASQNKCDRAMHRCGPKAYWPTKANPTCTKSCKHTKCSETYCENFENIEHIGNESEALDPSIGARHNSKTYPKRPRTFLKTYFGHFPTFFVNSFILCRKIQIQLAHREPFKNAFKL